MKNDVEVKDGWILIKIGKEWTLDDASLFDPTGDCVVDGVTCSNRWSNFMIQKMLFLKAQDPLPTGAGKTAILKGFTNPTNIHTTSGWTSYFIDETRNLVAKVDHENGSFAAHDPGTCAPAGGGTFIHGGGTVLKNTDRWITLNIS
ncbi:MAG: hypothetical protein V2I33_26370, partial [Kangiellaceae bacterium]|nr:hypothetical protein [Kangiellaceae bacterium]